MNKTFKYMNVINSTEINESHNRMLQKMQESINKVNDTAAIVEQQTYMNSVDRTYLEIAINDMASMLDQYNDFHTIRPSEFKSISNLTINSEKQFATRKIAKSTNKLFIDSNVLPEDLTLEAIADDDYNEIIDTDITTCVNKFNTPWVREIKTNDTVDEVYTTLYVYIPYSISTNDFVNEVIFDTFPFNAATVESVQYSKSYDIKYMMDISELKHNNGCIINQYSLPVGSNKNYIHLNFDTVKAKVIAITLKQTKFIQDGANRKFYLGIKNLKINYNVYLNGSIQFSVPYTPKSADGDYIGSIDIKYNNEVNETPIIKVYEGDTLVHNNFIPFTTSNKPVTFKFIYKSNVVPNINKILLYK